MHLFANTDTILFVQSFWYLCFGAVFILILLFKMSPFLRHLILSFDFTASLKSILKNTL